MHRAIRPFKLLLLFGGLSIIMLAAWMAYLYWMRSGNLALRKYRPPICKEILDDPQRVISYKCPFPGVRIWQPLKAIDKKLQDLVVLSEDAKFYSHEGLDFKEILNSLEKDLQKGKLVRGGSTITQQLAKNLFLTREKSFLRKASEVPLALRLERELTKSQILELYLNTIEWGPGVYGAEAASRLYFDHEASFLTTEEAWLLALMIPNPKYLNLWLYPKAKKSLLARAHHFSRRLYLEKKMNRYEADAAFEKFKLFLEEWAQKKPQAGQPARRFPMQWNP